MLKKPLPDKAVLVLKLSFKFILCQKSLKCVSITDFLFLTLYENSAIISSHNFHKTNGGKTKMKKIICIFLSMVMLLSCTLSVLADSNSAATAGGSGSYGGGTGGSSISVAVKTPEYEFGYYIDKVEYIGDNLAEATIVFTSQYGSDADMECIGFLAVYDDITKSYLNVSYKGYSEYKPFLDKQRYEVKQTVEIPDLTKLRYNFKFFVWDSTENIKPEGFVDLGNNSYILKKDDFTAKNTYYIESKLGECSLDPEDTRLAISVSKYDDNFINDFPYGTKIVVINNSNKINLTDYVGLLCNMTVYYDEETDDFILKDISVNTKKNNILCVDPMLYQGINQGRICYFADESEKTWCDFAKVEYPFSAYVNGIMMGVYNYDYSYNYDDYEINNYLGSFGITTDISRKINSNNKNYKFADTNNNGYYDTLLVENSASFVVDKIIDGVEFYPEESKSVYNSLTEFNIYDGVYEFYPSFYIGREYTTYTLHDTVGREVSNSDIKKGDVLTVKMSTQQPYRYYDITVSDHKITGNISEIYHGENLGVAKYMINGNSYTVNSSQFGEGMEAGVKGTFTLTPEGKIIKADLEDDFEYGIVTSTVIESDPYSCTAKVQMLTSKGERKLYTYADELKINYQYVNTSNIAGANMLFNADCYITPGSFAYYKTNENGEIYYITTYEDFTDKYTMEKAVCLTTYKESRGKLNGKEILDDTPIWCIAENGNFYNANSYVFADKTVLEDNTQYSVRAIYEADTKELKLVLITNLALEDDSVQEVLASNYGVVVAVSMAGDSTATGANGLSFMMIDEKGDMKIYSSTADIAINNVPYYDNGVAVANENAGESGTASGSTAGGGSLIEAGTVVLYETNENGKIKNIYTTNASINQKDATLGLLNVNGQYSSSKIGDITLTDSTSIVCIDGEEYHLSAYELYNSATLKDLDNDTAYDVSFIYDVETMEAKFAFIKNLYVEKTEQLTRKYGVLINSVIEHNAFEPRRSAQIMGTDGIARVYYFTSSFNVNGSSYMEDYATTGAMPFTSGTAVVFETNEDGQIRNIYTDKYSVNEAFYDLGLAYVTKEQYTDGRINGYLLDETTVVIGSKNSAAAAGVATGAESYKKYDISYLNETEPYSGTIIYNSDANKAVMFYITDFMLKPDYASAPMVVESVSEVYSDGKMREKITGYVNGERVSYTLSCNADDVDCYDVRGWRSGPMLKPGEAFQFIANEKDQIVAMRMIVQNYTYTTTDGSSTMTALAALKPADMKNNNIDNEYIPATLVDVRTGNDILDGYSYNMIGHAGIGKVNEKFEGEMDLFINTNLADNSMLQSDSNLITVYYDENVPAYFYGWDYEKPVVSTLSSVKSFEELGCIYDKLWGGTIAESTSSCEDMVYVYTYDGKNVFNYVFDPNSNSH